MTDRTRTDRRNRPASVLALVAGLVVSATALAQPKPALTRNLDEPGRNPYVESKQIAASVANCGTLTSCTFEFATVPADKRLVITYASVTFMLTGGGTVPEAALSAAGTGFIQLPLPTVPHAGTNDRWATASPVTFYVEPGAAPRIIVRGFDLADGFLVTMALSGYYVSLP